HAGAEVKGTGDGESLPLATGEGADQLIAAGHPVDPELAQAADGDGACFLDVETPKQAAPDGWLRRQDKVAGNAHQGERSDLLIDRGNAALASIARTGERHRVAVDDNLATRRALDPGEDLD